MATRKKAKKREWPGGETPGQQAGSDTSTIDNLWNYNITNPPVLQVPIYPPGWLIARIRQAPPASPITRRQGRYLLDLVRAIKLSGYRTYKAKLGISLDTPIHRLTKAEAWLLIHHISQDLEAAQ